MGFSFSLQCILGSGYDGLLYIYSPYNILHLCSLIWEYVQSLPHSLKYTKLFECCRRATSIGPDCDVSQKRAEK